MRDARGSVEFEAFFVIACAFAIGGMIALTLAIFDINLDEKLNQQHMFSQEQSVQLNVSEQTAGEQKRAWLTAMEQLLLHSNKEADVVHIGYKYDVCFLKDDECEISAKAFRDEFNKVTFYSTPSYFTPEKSHASFYLLLKEGQRPYVQMRLVYVGKEWAHIDKASILVNGEFVFNEKISEVRMQRKAVTGSLVYELSDLPLNEQLNVIRKIADAQSISVRLEGSTGSVALDSEALTNFKQQANEVLSMYELTMQALERENFDP